MNATFEFYLSRDGNAAEQQSGLPHANLENTL